MRNYAVLGLGMMGEAIIFDLLTNDENAIVHGFDVNKDRRIFIKTKFVEYGNRFHVYHLKLNISTDTENN